MNRTTVAKRSCLQEDFNLLLKLHEIAVNRHDWTNPI